MQESRGGGGVVWTGKCWECRGERACDIGSWSVVSGGTRRSRGTSDLLRPREVDAVGVLEPIM